MGKIFIILLFISGALSANPEVRRRREKGRKWVILPGVPAPRPAPANPPANCLTVAGCITGGTAMCNAGAASNMCDVSNAADTTQCHWPAVPSGCTRVGTTPDCICEPAAVAPANCLVVDGCAATGSTALCNAGPANNMCDISDPTALTMCHWPDTATGCAQVGTTPDCTCEPAAAAPANCLVVDGCAATGSTALCNAGPAGDMCDVTDPTALTMCHWPDTTTGCAQVGTTPDCTCEPAAAAPANCLVVDGCAATGSTALCNAGPAGDMCDVTDPTALTMCHWPDTATGCAQVGTTPDCTCEPAAAAPANCLVVDGCAATGSTALCNAGPGGDMCDVTDPTALTMCHWPDTATGCAQVGTTPDCTCEPATG